MNNKRNINVDFDIPTTGGTGPFVRIKRTNAEVTAVYLGGK